MEFEMLRGGVTARACPGMPIWRHRRTFPAPGACNLPAGVLAALSRSLDMVVARACGEAARWGGGAIRKLKCRGQRQLRSALPSAVDLPAPAHCGRWRRV